MDKAKISHQSRFLELLVTKIGKGPILLDEINVDAYILNRNCPKKSNEFNKI